MIKFLTERNDHPTTYPRTTKDEILDYCKGKRYLGFDCEFNKLDAYTAQLLIVTIGDEHMQFAIDGTSVDISFLSKLTEDYESSPTFIGHNIKIDYKMAKVRGFEFRKVYDTMIVEQRLGLGSGRKNGLDATLERRLNIAMSKDIRKEFIHMFKGSHFEDRHLKYACEDIEHMVPLMKVQEPYIQKFDMTFLLYGIEFPLIPIMGDCDLEGFVLDRPNWQKIIDENKEERRKLIKQMDEEVKKLILEHRPDLAKGRYTHERQDNVETQFDLFGPPKVVEHVSPHNIKYTAPAQVKQLFHDLGITPPLKKEKETLEIDHLKGFLLMNPDTILKDFLEIYIEHSRVNKQISTYGEKFLNRINPVTGRIHTVFRHCSTDTGRFASGDSKAGYPNMQNIPADNKFRHCFGVEEGYEVTTCDLSGAELIVMVALSGDLRLLELASGDMHSHMANMCWEKIYRMRGEVWGEEDKISKTQNKQKRTDFKPMTFGVIYGMYKKKAAEQLNVHVDEGEVVVQAIKQEIPDVIKMVETAGKFALTHGYVVHNTRTNSRRWFASVLDAKKELAYMKKHHPCDQVPGIPWYMEYDNAKPEHLMKFLDKSDAESAARNTRIQGTQADMVKEAIVEIDRLIREKNLDLTLLGTVHDELIYKHPKGYRVDDMAVGEWIAKQMKDTANLYLEGVVKMGADYETMDTWTK